ncbi:MAG: endonuclease Q family protein, partial [Candidatus Bathyarchaeota archaeon]|nr:endonuclease Q family protein [Candidatus Bathyarchaeota archaeon]
DVYKRQHLPSFEVVEQVNEKLSRYGELSVDGRPILDISSPELVEILIEVDSRILIYPAHAWTPWMSCLGSRSGFNSLEECYQEQVNHVFSLETGLSSDPAMNWRVSKLDRFTLLSNSDSHSPNTLRLGREANIFNVKKLSYMEIYEAIKNKDRSKFLCTIETDPSYGKYHYDGHRGCGVSLSPAETKKLNNTCPKCGKTLTIGVLHRVEELADRPEGFIPENAIPFKSLLPLYEIIFFTFNGKITSKAILEEQNKLISKFSNELNILLNVSKEELLKVTHKKIVEAIIRVREGKIKYIAGYDGVYGKPIIYSEDDEKKIVKSGRCSKSLEEFF